MAPSKARRKRSLREITTTVSIGPIANSQPASSSLMKKEEDQKEEFPKEPTIQPLPPIMVNLVPQKGLGFEPMVGSLVPSRNKEYKPNGKYIVGNHPIYAIGFNFMDVKYYDVFATASGNSVTVYWCLENGSFGLLQAYIDEDKDESFYTLSWARDPVDDSIALLVAAGTNRIIRVINCGTQKLVKSLVGHGDAINEIKTHVSKPSLIISASKDESVRLWNIHTGVCILIFKGAGGHRNDVLSVDFHPTEIEIFASCGMDKTVKIWSMKEFWTYVEKSYSWTDHRSKFPTKRIQFPVLSVKVHSDFVDCTRWLGDFILSKGVENEILLWEPKPDKNRLGEGSVDVLQKYPLPHGALWFMKFSCDFHFNQLAVGNSKGEVYVWEVQSCPPVLIDRLTQQEFKSPIRQTAVSFNGSTILGAGEDGTIWRWDEVSRPSGPKAKASSSKTKTIQAAPAADANA